MRRKFKIGKAWRRIFAMMLAMAIISTAVPVDVRGDNQGDVAGVSDNGILEEYAGYDEGAVYDAFWENAENAYVDMTENANDMRMLQLPDNAVGTYAAGGADRPMAIAAQQGLFDNTTIELANVSLKATYKDENGNTVIVDLLENGTAEFPYDANISMRLEFIMGDSSAIKSGVQYVYHLPDDVDVKVDANHELKDENGKSIGNVHISPDGTLTFEFYEEALAGDTNVSFFVQFDGELSEDKQEAGKEGKLEFPTSNGTWDTNYKTTEPEYEEKEPELQDVGIQKSGTVVTGEDGKRYIEWTITLNPNGRKELSGDIIDILQEGLTLEGAPWLEGTIDQDGPLNGAQYTYNPGTGELQIHLDGVTTYWDFKVKYRTSYDESLFGDAGIKNGSHAWVDNTAAFNPDDETPSVEATGRVDVSPDLIDKSGILKSENGDIYIEWTVTLNTEGLDISGATFKDVFGEGFTWENDNWKDSISITPPELKNSLQKTNDGFELQIPSNAPFRNKIVITYRTKVTDGSLSSYTNKGELKDEHIDVSDSATVKGVDWINKYLANFDPVTNTFTWTIEVGEDGLSLDDVTVKDWFDSSMMDFVRAEMDGKKLTPSRTGTRSEVIDNQTVNCTELEFQLGHIDGKKTITIVTKAKEGLFDESDPQKYFHFVNFASVTADGIEQKDSADSWTHLKDPDLMAKEGQNLKNGMIHWRVTVYGPQGDLKVQEITFKDTLPEGTTLVDGSIVLHVRWWDFVEPLYLDSSEYSYNESTRELTFHLDKTKYGNFITNGDGFWIDYDTKVVNMEQAKKGTSYTNHAEVEITYEGDVTLEDDKRATVQGPVDGILDKSASYRDGDDYVDWTVTVNEGRFDFSTMTKPPVLRDKLEDYFTYVSGTLYEMLDDGKGTLVEVNASEYTVTVFNNELTVQLPKDIGTKCYVFKFRTRFNVQLAEELAGKTIQNTISMEGFGQDESRSGSVSQDVHFSSSSAGATTKHEIRIKKVDSVTGQALAGAVFELWYNGVKVGEAVSGEDGFAVFEGVSSLVGYEISLRETLPPVGYELMDDGSYVITDYVQGNIKTDDKGVSYYEIEIPNKKIGEEEAPTGEAQIHKVNAQGRALQGAEFTLYDDAGCTKRLGAKTTDAEGYVKFSPLEVGRDYWIKETKAPAGYVLPNPAPVIKVTVDEEGNVTYSGGGGSLKTGYYELTNEPAVLYLTLKKTGAGGAALQGALFGLFTDEACSDEIERATSDASGSVVFKTKLTPGKTYYYMELDAPNGYVRDKEVHKITIGTGTENADIHHEITVPNELALGNIVITKVDDSTPPNALSGVVFGLYYKESGLPYQKDGKAYTVTTDSNGRATFKDIPFGEYIIKEISIDGQVADGNGIIKAKNTAYKATADTDITVNVEGDIPVTIVNEIVRCDIQLTKRETGSEATLSGAVYELYTSTGRLVGRATTGADGKLTFKNVSAGNYYLLEVTAPKGHNIKNERINITIDRFGVVTGTGVITEQAYNDKQDGKILLYKQGAESLTSDELKGLSGATFTLYDADMLPIATCVSTAAGGASDWNLAQDDIDKLQISGLDANSPGLVYFSGLPYGTYYLRETNPPAGYLRDPNTYKIEVKDDEVIVRYVSYTSADGSAGQGEGTLVIDNEIMNPPFISVKIKKVNSETATGLPNTMFGLYGKLPGSGEVILIATAVTGNDGIAYFRKISTKEVGVKEIPSETVFFIKEIEAPTGYEGDLDQEVVLGRKDFELNLYADPRSNDQNTPDLRDEEIYWAGTQASESDPASPPESAVIENDPLKGKIEITKTGPTNTSAQAPLANAQFTLYAKADCTEVVQIDGVENPVTTNANGIAVFENLPIGTYYVKETQAPKGYILNETVYEVKVVMNADTPEADRTFKVAVRDSQINITISKRGLTGTAELQGAVFKIYDADDPDKKAVDSWTTNNTSPHRAIGLTVGKTYVLTEMIAPDGYAYIEDVVFTVEKDGSIKIDTNPNEGNIVFTESNGTRLVVRDVPIGLSVVKEDPETHTPLLGATLAILSRDASGKETELVRFTTERNAYVVPTGVLKVPKPDEAPNVYILRELVAPDGYGYADDVIFEVHSDGRIVRSAEYTDEAGTIAGPVNNRFTLTLADPAKVNAYFRKVDSETGADLEGAVFRIYEVKADGTTEQVQTVRFTTGTHPTEVRVVPNNSEEWNEVLKVGKTYELREAEAPTGYYLPPEGNWVRFEVYADGTKNKLRITDGNLTARVNSAGDTIIVSDRAINLKVRKQDVYGTILNGATLQITEYNTATKSKVGEPIYTFTTSGNRVEEIPTDDLKGGKSYILEEVQPPAGYNKAEGIIFTLQENGIITREDGLPVVNNTIVMEDEANGVQIGKISLDGVGLAGCTLHLESVQGEKFDAHFEPETWKSDEYTKTWSLKDFTPGCEYELSEIEAPVGYAYADPIVFEVGADHQLYIDGQLVGDRLVYIADGRIQFEVSKQDLYTKEEVPGAVLAILDPDDDNKEVSRWTTGITAWRPDSSNMIAPPNEGEYKEYILTEVTPPDGYYRAADIRFAVDKWGVIHLVTGEEDNKTYTKVPENILIMREEPMFSVRKMDTDGKYVVGATLQITAKDDASFEAITWETTNAPKFFDLGSGENPFKPNTTYVLKELKAPDGYKVAESLEFKINDAGQLFVNDEQVDNLRIVMLDYKVDEPAKDGATNTPGQNTPGQSKDPGKAPKTGDDTPLAMLILLCITGLLGASSSFIKYIIWKRKHRVYD